MGTQMKSGHTPKTLLDDVCIEPSHSKVTENSLFASGGTMEHSNSHSTCAQLQTMNSPPRSTPLPHTTEGEVDSNRVALRFHH